MTGIPIRGVATGTAAQAYAIAVKRGAAPSAKTRRFFDALYVDAATAGTNADVHVAQWDLETGAGTSFEWLTNTNPGGVGVFPDGTTAGYTFTPESAARELVTHNLVYAGIPLPPGWKKSKRWDVVVAKGWAGTVTTTDDYGNDKWATDTEYARKLRERYEAYWGDAPAGETTVTYSTTIPGLPGGPLTTLVPVRIKLIPASQTYQRPGIKASSPRRSVQHGNGNPNSTAAGEAGYLYSGAEGRQASYHSAVDDKEIWVMVPADEVTWQAADSGGPGNMNGFSCEMVEDASLWADPTRRAAVIRNTADFMGRVSARLGIAKPEQHWDFNYMLPSSLRHDCPEKLRYVTIGGRKAWDIYAEQWQASKAAELKAMGGEVVTPTPDTTAYAKPLAIAELAGMTLDKYDNVDGVVSRDADDFVFVADVVEAVVATPRLQYAASGAPKVGPDIAKGERFVVTWLVKAGDGEWYYITPYWTRVRRKDTKRIADAPTVPTESLAQAA